MKAFLKQKIDPAAVKQRIWQLPMLSETVFGPVRAIYFFVEFRKEQLQSPIKTAKIIQSVTQLIPLLVKITPHTKQIILKGTRGSGTNSKTDIYELYIIANHPETVKNLIKTASTKLLRPLRYEIFSPQEALQFKQDSQDKKSLYSVEETILWMHPDQIIDTSVK